MKHEFEALKRKILLHVLLIAAMGLLLWGVIQFVFIAGTVRMPDVLQMSITETGELVMDTAGLSLLISTLDARQNTYLLTIGVLFVLLAAFYYTMMRLTRYFREVSAGVDKLLPDGGEPISLSPEMAPMQFKLNSVKAELRRREQDARNAEQRKDELLVYLAHDIRTPLTTVIGYLNLMLEKPELPREQRAKYLGLTLESARRLEALTGELFEVTRLNAQGMRLDVQVFDLCFLLRQLADSFYPMLEPEGKRIEIDAPLQLLIHGDADKLARVFRNILKNAATFSDDHSVIRIAARESDDRLTVSIENTGIGIPQDQLQAVFDKFHRLDNARSAKTGGAGLGLAIAKEIVLAHGGDISAANAANETTFIVALPRKKAE